LEIQKLAPNNDVQRSLHWHAAKISNDLAQAHFMLFCRIRKSDSDAISRNFGILARDRIREL
jgi:hypothetical protein